MKSFLNQDVSNSFAAAGNKTNKGIAMPSVPALQHKAINLPAHVAQAPKQILQGDDDVAQLAAVAADKFPAAYFISYQPVYISEWRNKYFRQANAVFTKFSIVEIMAKLNALDPALMPAALRDALATIKTSYTDNVVNFETAHGTKDAVGQLAELTTFVTALDTFLDTHEDRYNAADKTEKERLAKVLVKITVDDDLEWHDDAQGKEGIEAYKAKLLAHILSDSRRIQMLRGKDSLLLHLRDDDPAEVTAAITTAIAEIRTDPRRLNTRIKPTADTEWEDWRKNDCVFAAIIYVMNNNVTKYTSVLGRNPRDLGDEDAERDDAGGIADQLGIGKGVVEDPVLFNIMKRLGWTYLPGKTWANWATARQYDGAATYIISYSVTADGSSNHTVVFRNGVVYDRQARRLGGRDNGVPVHTTLPMEVWQVDTAAAAEILE
ncbi:hypothetical protein ACI6Q2_17535 [Chitinophagaceae bacterium LWZ2-11]